MLNVGKQVMISNKSLNLLKVDYVCMYICIYHINIYTYNLIILESMHVAICSINVNSLMASFLGIDNNYNIYIYILHGASSTLRDMQ